LIIAKGKMAIEVGRPTQQFLDDRKVSSWGIWEKENAEHLAYDKTT
jgi:hypothetical protein